MGDINSVAIDRFLYRVEMRSNRDLLESAVTFLATHEPRSLPQPSGQQWVRALISALVALVSDAVLVEIV